MKRFYAAAPIDEVSLLDSVRTDRGARVHELPSTEELVELSREKSPDYAVCALYLALTEGPRFAPYVRAIDSQPARPAHSGKDRAKVLLVPAMFYQSHPEVGGGGEHILEISKQCGFESSRINTLSPGPVSKNARIIAEALAKEESAEIWLMTLSRGALEFRMAMENHPELIPWKRIKGWIACCGFPYGNGLVAAMRLTPFERFKFWISSYAIGSTPQEVMEMSPEFWTKRKPISVPDTVKVLNFIPVPLSSHIQTSLVGRYHLIGKIGPNDGMTTIRTSLVLPGEVYPVWGADHFFRSSGVVPLLYRFFNYLRTV